MHVKTRTERRRDSQQGHAVERILFKEIIKIGAVKKRMSDLNCDLLFSRTSQPFLYAPSDAVEDTASRCAAAMSDISEDRQSPPVQKMRFLTSEADQVFTRFAGRIVTVADQA